VPCNLEEWRLQAMGGDVAHRGQLSAWLQKKKSGASAFRMREYNKRYFTLDFDTHTFFYSHSEGSKKVSAVTSFADIVDVHMPQADKGDNISEYSKVSKRSFLRRTTSFLAAAKDAEEQHLVTVMTRPAKTFELLCSSATEAVTWFEALKNAIAMDKDRDAVEAGHTTATSEGEEPPKGLPMSGGYPTRPELMATVAGARDGESDRDGDASPPPLKGTFLDLTVEESAPAPVREAGPAEGATVVETGAVALQAADFGFAEEEDSDAKSSSSEEEEVGVGAAEPVPATRATGGYGDRHEGMSMQERLASLEFSDDEEDDDDPLGLKR